MVFSHSFCLIWGKFGHDHLMTHKYVHVIRLRENSYAASKVFVNFVDFFKDLFFEEKTLDLITLHFKKMSNRKRTTGNGFVKRWWFFLKCKMCLPHNMVVVANFAISPHQKHDPKYGVTLLHPLSMMQFPFLYLVAT